LNIHGLKKKKKKYQGLGPYHPRMRKKEPSFCRGKGEEILISAIGEFWNTNANWATRGDVGRRGPGTKAFQEIGRVASHTN